MSRRVAISEEEELVLCLFCGYWRLGEPEPPIDYCHHDRLAGPKGEPLTMNPDDDKELLDALDGLDVPDGFGWKVRPSTTGRGWRLMTTREQPNHASARRAIAAFIEERERP